MSSRTWLLFVIVSLSFTGSLSLSPVVKTSVCNQTSNIFSSKTYVKSLCYVRFKKTNFNASIFCADSGMKLLKMNSSGSVSNKVFNFVETIVKGSKSAFISVDGRKGLRCLGVTGDRRLLYDWCSTLFTFICEYQNSKFSLQTSTTRKYITSSTKIVSTHSGPIKNSTLKPTLTSRPIFTTTKMPETTTTKQTKTSLEAIVLSTTKQIETTTSKKSELTTITQTFKPVDTTSQRLSETSTTGPTTKSTTKPSNTNTTRLSETSSTAPITTSTSRPVDTTATRLSDTSSTSTTKPITTSTSIPSEKTSTTNQITTSTSGPVNITTTRLSDTSTTSTTRPIPTLTSRPSNTTSTKLPETSTTRALMTSSSKPVDTTTTTTPIDFCTISTCALNQHIACNNNGSFYSTCQSPQAITLTTANIQQFVIVHNTYRNTVASGQLANFSSARRMPKLVWNNELAGYAALNTRQCQMKHDACRNTLVFQHSGQNLAVKGTSLTFTIEEIIAASIKMWYDENRAATMVNIGSYGTPSTDGSAIGHFTSMLTDRTTQLGCAISTYLTSSSGFTLTNYLCACNYASTNMKGWPVYKPGNPASNCINGPDSEYPGLCKISEPIDPNSNDN